MTPGDAVQTDLYLTQEWTGL